MARTGLEALFDELRAAAVELDDALGRAHETPGPAVAQAVGPTGDPGTGPESAASIGARAAGYARAHPWQVLLGAVAVGYLIGRLGRGRAP